MHRSLPPLIAGLILGGLGTAGLALAGQSAHNTITTARAELAAARALIDEADRPAARDELRRRLATVDGLLASLQTSGGGGGGGGPAMSSQKFDRFLVAIDDASGREARIGLVRRAAMDHRFTVDQVILTMEAFKFGADQVDVAATMHARVVDKRTWSRVYDVFTSEGDARELRRRVGG